MVFVVIVSTTIDLEKPKVESMHSIRSKVREQSNQEFPTIKIPSIDIYVVI